MVGRSSSAVDVFLLLPSFFYIYLSGLRFFEMINYVEFLLNSKRLTYVLELAIADICFGFENQNTRALHIYKVNMLFSVLIF